MLMYLFVLQDSSLFTTDGLRRPRDSADIAELRVPDHRPAHMEGARLVRAAVGLSEFPPVREMRRLDATATRRQKNGVRRGRHERGLGRLVLHDERGARDT